MRWDEGIQPNWEECRASHPSVLINDSYGIVWDCSPKGFAASSCTERQCSHRPFDGMCLPCDWNVITFYVTPFLYNASEIPWDKVRRHISNHYGNNLTLDVKQLQDTIQGITHADLQNVPGLNLANTMDATLSPLNPLQWFKNNGTSLLGVLL